MNIIEKAFRSVLDRINGIKEKKVAYEDFAKRFTAAISIPPALIHLGQAFRRRRIELRKAQLRHQRARTCCKPGFERLYKRPHAAKSTYVSF